MVNRTRDLPVCSAVPQPTAPSRLRASTSVARNRFSFAECHEISDRTTANQSIFYNERRVLQKVAEGWRKTCGVPGSCFWRRWLCRSSPQMNPTPVLPKLTSCHVAATCALTNSKSGNYLHHTTGLKLLAWTWYETKRPQTYFTVIHFDHISRLGWLWRQSSRFHLQTLLGFGFTTAKSDSIKKVFTQYQTRGTGTLNNVEVCHITEIHRVIQNDCRGFNNLSHTIHFR